MLRQTGRLQGTEFGMLLHTIVDRSPGLLLVLQSTLVVSDAVRDTTRFCTHEKIDKGAVIFIWLVASLSVNMKILCRSSSPHNPILLNDLTSRLVHRNRLYQRRVGSQKVGIIQLAGNVASKIFRVGIEVNGFLPVAVAGAAGRWQ
jgi:hypothetical protein